MTTDKTYVIRPMKSEDAGEVIALEEQAFGKHLASKDRFFHKGDFQDFLTGRCYEADRAFRYVLTEQETPGTEKILGMIAAVHRRGALSERKDGKKISLEGGVLLDEFAVRQEHQDEGHGSKLFQHLMNKIEEYYPHEVLEVDVYPQNIKGRSFYKKNSFIEVAHKNQLWRKFEPLDERNNDAMLLQRPVSGQKNLPVFTIHGHPDRWDYDKHKARYEMDLAGPSSPSKMETLRYVQKSSSHRLPIRENLSR